MSNNITTDMAYMPSRGPLVVAVVTSVVAAAFLAVVLRFIARGVLVRRITVDDWLVAVAWVLSFGMSFSICFATRYGLGMYHVDMSERDLSLAHKARYAFTLLYVGFTPGALFGATLIQWLIVVFYLGLSENYRLLRIANWVTLAVVNIAGVTLTLLIAFQCKPVSVTFQSSLPSTAKCIDTYTLLYASGPVNLITDLAILVLPMPILTSLRLPKKQKMILIALFAGGGFVAVVGIVRIHYFEKAVATGRLDWDGALSFMWAAIEVNVGVLCASIPMIKPLAARLFPGWFGPPPPSPVSSDPPTSSSREETPEQQFFNLHRPRSALTLTLRESLRPAGVVTALFFMWGFAYGFIDTLNKRLEEFIGITTEQYIGLHAAYFGAYFLSPLIFSGSCLKRYGFKVTFMTGLTICGCGCLIFWPSAVLKSYVGFCISIFVVGSGLSTIEVAANIFMVLCGPSKYIELRLSIAQSLHPIGLLLSSLIAGKVLPDVSGRGDASLADVQWIYLAFGLFAFCMAFSFYYADIPEVKDSDFAGKQKGDDEHKPHVFKSKYAFAFSWGTLAQGCYCGSQEVIMSFSIAYLGKHLFQSSPHIRTGQALFLAGRFICIILVLFIKPRYILLMLLSGATIFCALAMSLRDSSVEVVMLVMIWLCASATFPLIYALAVRGLGVYSKDASMYQVSSAGAGAVFPGVYYAILQHKGGNKLAAQYAMCVPLTLFAVATTYPIYLSLRPKERKRLRRIPEDEVKRTRMRRRHVEIPMTDV